MIIIDYASVCAVAMHDGQQARKKVQAPFAIDRSLHRILLTTVKYHFIEIKILESMET